jgi:hypothetical protein
MSLYNTCTHNIKKSFLLLFRKVVATASISAKYLKFNNNSLLQQIIDPGIIFVKPPDHKF